MVNLPRIPIEKSVTDPPRSQVSGSEITSAYSALAQGLGAIGANFEQAEVADAQWTGADSVYRDADGAVKYTPRSRFTVSGRAHNAAARVAALATIEAESRGRIQAFRIEAKGDIKTFDAATRAYVNELVGKADTPMKGHLRRQLEGDVSISRAGLVNDTVAADMAANEKQIKFEIDFTSAEMASLARQGGTQTPEYRERLDKVRTLWQQLSANPAFATTARETELRVKRMMAEHVGEWTLGRIDDEYEKGGIEGARKFIEEELNNPALPLTPAERQKYQRQGRTWLTARRQEQSGKLRELKKEIAPVIKDFEAGIGLDDTVVDDYLAELEGYGDIAYATRLRMARERFRFNAPFAAASDKEQTDVLEQMERRATGADVPMVLKKLPLRTSVPTLEGVNPDLLTRFTVVQNQFGKSVPIVSSVRDAGTNKAAGGVKRSQHLTGNAIDLDVSDLSKPERVQLIEIASVNGITGIGVYQNSLHFDLGKRRAWGPTTHVESVPPWAYSAVTRHLRGGSRATPVIGATVESLWPYLLGQESGGKQFDPEGRPLTSPRGAIGIAQVMPETGPEAARLAGLPWDERRFHEDQEYNEALGKAYLGQQLKDFDGDAVKALAAYNAGPGRVRDAVAKAGDRWLSLMPGETRNYVAGLRGGTTVDLQSYKVARTEVVSDMKKNWEAMRAGLLKGYDITGEDVSFLQRQMALVGDEDFNSQVSNFFESRIDQFPDWTPYDQDQVMAAIQADGVDIDEVEILDSMRAIHKQTIEDRDKDMISLIARVGNYSKPVAPIDFSSDEAFGRTLKERQGVVDFGRHFYDKPDQGAFKKVEVDELAGRFASSSLAAKMTILEIMSANLTPETYMATVAQFADKAGPVFGFAGGLMRDNYEAAKGILRGMELLKQNDKLAPSLTNEKTASVMVEAFPMTVISPDIGSAYSVMMDSARARYADLAAEVGDQSGTLDELRWARAVKEVTGGFVEYNGKSVIAPVYGMPQNEFDATMAGLTDADVYGAVTRTGKQIGVSQIINGAVLTSVGDGQYTVQIKTGVPARGVVIQSFPFAMSVSGQKFVLDLRPEIRAQKARSYGPWTPWSQPPHKYTLQDAGDAWDAIIATKNKWDPFRVRPPRSIARGRPP